MEKFKKFGAAFFIGVYLLVGFAVFTPKVSLALDEVKFTPQIGIPGSDFQQKTEVQIGATTTEKNPTTGKVETIMHSNLLARYIQAFYNWGLSIAGVLAVLMLMAGGLIWLTSAGDSGKIGTAKKMIEGSLLGTALLVGAWFFLNTINPNLTNLPSIDTVMIIPYSTGCCKENGLSKMTISNDCKGSFNKNEMLNSSGECEKKVCCVSKFTLYGVDANYCFSSLISQCSGKNAGQECSEVAECKGLNSIQLSCDGVANGKTANGYKQQSGYPFFCYNQNVYADKGEYGEPCGTKGDNNYGVCIKKSESCSDENNYGGRFCNSASSLKCCLDSGMW